MKPFFLCAVILTGPLGAAEHSNPAASASALPSGTGLAASHPQDNGIALHQAVIFADDFEEGSLGEGWAEINNPNRNVLSFADPGNAAGLGKRCLQVEAHLGKDTGGGLTRWFDPPDTVFVRFYSRFDPACDYIHHFVGLRGNKGLNGADKWSGFGQAGMKPTGDERFSTRIEPWGNHGRSEPPGRWNFYSYWHEMKASGDGKYWGNQFEVPAAPVVPRGSWICVEFMLKHNTPGQPDGEQAFWIDGVLQGHWKGINWRKTAYLKANALNLESYVTERWTKNPINRVWFDQVVVASQYIGPVASK
jgi:hypothetical protein